MVPARLLTLVGAAALLLASVATADLGQLPHRQSRLRVDGHLDDWRGPSFTVELREPEEPAPQANFGIARLVWDAERLWLAFEVNDAEVVAPSPEVAGPDLAFYDSVELYLDVEGNGGPRMGADDFQVIVTCDGRVAVLQGDPLAASVSTIAVPKSERHGIGIAAAATRTASGYVVECAVPFPAVGVVDATRDRVIGLDLAWNDWVEEHPPLSWPRLTVDALSRMSHGEEPGGKAQWEAIEAWSRRAYRPWSLAGVRDFGYPEQWRRLRLTGRPALAERLVSTVGAWNLVLAVALILAAAWGSVTVALTVRHRKRFDALLRRLAEVEARGSDTGGQPPPPASPAPPAEPSPEDMGQDVLSGRTGAIRTLLGGGDPQSLAERAIVVVHGRLGENLPPAALADELHVSLRTLQRGLAETLRCTPGELILALKMREAKRLLAGGNRQVSEVASALGFANPYHFSRRFKAHFRMAPSDVARAAKEGRPG